MIQATFEKCLFKRCGNVKALDLREIAFLGSPTFQVPIHRTRSIILDTLGRVQLSLHLVALCLVPSSLTMSRRTSSRLCHCVMIVCAPMCTSFSHYSFEAFLCPMTSWICQWKPFWIPVGDSFQKAYLEEWVRVGAVPSEEPSSADQGDVIPETP